MASSYSSAKTYENLKMIADSIDEIADRLASGPQDDFSHSQNDLRCISAFVREMCDHKKKRFLKILRWKYRK